MYYYEIMASKSKDNIVHREYAAFVNREDAETLKIEMSRSYDVVGVNRITRKQYLARVSEI